MDTKKVILDLCGGTGSWSKPYKEAEYVVHNITLPDYDILATEIRGETLIFGGGNRPAFVVNIQDVHGILAAPPCTMFSDARTNAKEPRDLRGGYKIVKACLRIIEECMYQTKSDQQKYSPLKFWALENPWYGRLKWFLGRPPFIFDPWEFGDAYKKRTAIWGYFIPPVKTVTDMTKVMTKEQIEKHKTNSQVLPKFDYLKSKQIHPEAFGKYDRQARRAITPQGFANAFYKANL